MFSCEPKNLDISRSRSDSRHGIDVNRYTIRAAISVREGGAIPSGVGSPRQIDKIACVRKYGITSRKASTLCLCLVVIHISEEQLFQFEARSTEGRESTRCCASKNRVRMSVTNGSIRGWMKGRFLSRIFREAH
jgi:hypothetical protein